MLPRPQASVFNRARRTWCCGAVAEKEEDALRIHPIKHFAPVFTLFSRNALAPGHEAERYISDKSFNVHKQPVFKVPYQFINFLEDHQRVKHVLTMCENETKDEVLPRREYTG